MPDLPLPHRAIPSLISDDTLAVTRVVLLTFASITDWFSDRVQAVAGDGDRLLLTVAEDLQPGRISLIQGIFSSEAGSFSEARRIQAADIDERVRAVHNDRRVVLWNRR